MAEEAIAAVPAGTQTTWNNPLGPQPTKSSRGETFRKAFQELTHDDVKPKEETPVEPTKEEPKVEPVKEEPKSTETVATDKKPESPLDAVLAKPKEALAEEPDVLKEFESVTPPKGMAENWEKARKVMQEQRETIQRLSKQEKQPQVDPAVIEALTKERDELQARYADQEKKLKAVNYRYSDEYQALVQDKEKLVTKISNRVKSYGGDDKALVEALSLPESKVRTQQIREALAEVEPDDKPRIYALMEQLEAQDEKLADAEKQADVKFDELSSKRQVQKAEQSQTVVKEIETNFAKVAEAIPANTVTMREVPDDVPGGTEWNQEIKAAWETALRVLKPGGADFNQSAEIAAKGARYDSLEKRYLQLYSEHSDLKKSYQEAVGSGPDFKGGQKPPQPKTPGYKRGSFLETLAAVKEGAVE